VFAISFWRRQFVSLVSKRPRIRRMLFGVDPLDLPSMVGAALLLVAAAALASYVPRSTGDARQRHGNASRPVMRVRHEAFSIAPLDRDTLDRAA
jgi:hypothetical protein